MKVLIDTNFILTCLKEKIDFLLAGEFGKIVLPVEVIEELENLAGKTKGRKKSQAELALRIIEKNMGKFEFVDLENKFVDAGILDFVEGKKDIVVATLDKELKKQLKGKVKLLVIRARKKLNLF